MNENTDAGIDDRSRGTRFIYSKAADWILRLGQLAFIAIAVFLLCQGLYRLAQFSLLGAALNLVCVVPNLAILIALGRIRDVQN